MSTRILIIDDNSTNLKLASQLLAMEGHDVTEAIDAQDALEKLVHLQPDIILVDIAMPGMDGLTLTRKLKAIPQFSSTPMIALSAFAMKGDEQKALDAGCDGYITKPINTRTFAQTVLGYLPAQGYRMHLLIVDDHDMNLKLLRAQLEAEGHTVIEARDGIEALEVMNLEMVDGVISDILMPRMDGYRLCLEVRKSPHYGRVPFVLYTSTYNSQADRELAVSAGADAYIAKPAPTHVILKALRASSTSLRQAAAPGTTSEIENPVLVQYSASLVRKLEDKSMELARAYEGLIQVEARLSGLVETAMDAIIAINEQHQVVLFNASAGLIFGWSPEEAMGRPLNDFIPSRSRDLHDKHLEGFSRGSLNQKRMGTRQVSALRKDGTEFPIEASISKLETSQGRLYTVFVRDITERQLTEQALLESEMRFRQISENVNDVFFLRSPDASRVLYMSPAFEEIWGESRDIIYADATRWAESIHAEDRHYVQQHLAAGSELGTYEIKYRIVRPDGSLRWIETRGFPVYDSHGSIIRIAGVARDITRQQLSDVARVQSEAALQRAQELALLAHVITGANGQFESWSTTLPSLIGLEPEQMPVRLQDWLELIHEDDRPVFLHLVEESLDIGKHEELEYRICRMDSWVYVRHVVEDLPAKNFTGTMYRRYFHTLQDVSEQKQAEIKVRSLNRVYAVLSGINTLIVRVRNREELFSEACRIAVEEGNFPKAWIGLTEEGGKTIRLVAGYGAPATYFEKVQQKLTEDVKRGIGVITAVMLKKQALHSETPEDLFNMSDAVQGEVFRTRSLAALPLIIDGTLAGVLVLHAEVVDYFNSEEMKLLIELAGDIAFAIDHLGKREQVQYLANYDPLTGLPNRNLFSERLEQAIQGMDNKKDVLAVVLIDIDRFRRVNETLGRMTGDELLRMIATRLKSLNGSVARMGLDVFAFMIRDMHFVIEIAHAIAETFSSCFGEPFTIGNEELRIGCRGGCALFPDDGTNAEMLLRNAESALRRARFASEPCVFYAPIMNARAAEALALENKLRRAIERQEFILHYQPKVDLADGRIVGVEALMRWLDPEKGLIYPSHFISVLEEARLIATVGQWAIEQAMADSARWMASGHAPLRVAVNVSPMQLNRPEFVTGIHQLVTSAPDVLLELEITEGMIMEEVERKVEMLKDIRRLGVSIAIDDFGTGYCSLSYIAKLPVTSLKIDRSFVIRMNDGPEAMAIVSSIIALAHALKLKVVAEGVETEEQAMSLQQLACDEAQGFLYSKAVSADEIEKILMAGGKLHARQII